MKYYSVQQLLSFNAFFNIIMSNRGTGKTTDVTRYIIKRFIEQGYQFLFVKRNKEDIKSTAEKFFDSEYLEHKFPDHTFSFKRGKFYIDDQEAGYCAVLNVPTRNKGIPLEHVGTIIFDEFITEDGRYITAPGRPYQEVENLMSLIDTVNRGYNRLYRDELKVFLLSNAISIINPYFAYFNIDKKWKPGKRFIKGNEWVMEFFIDEEIAKEKQKGAFGRFIKDTEYGKYALMNKFYLDNDAFIAEPPAHCFYQCTFIYAGEKYGVWEDKRKNIYYISEKYDKYCKVVYSLAEDDHNEETFLLSSKYDVYKGLRASFDSARVRFSSMRCKTVLISFLNHSL